MLTNLSVWRHANHCGWCLLERKDAIKAPFTVKRAIFSPVHGE